MTDRAAYTPTIGDDLPPGPRPMIAIIDALPGHDSELRSSVIELTNAVRSEPGCLTFVAYEAVDAPGRFYLYEIYRSTQSFRDHLDTDHVLRFFDMLAQHSSADASALSQLLELPLGAPTPSGCEPDVSPPTAFSAG